MSIVDERPTAEAGEPEEPTNRPEPSYRLREWLSRPYVRHLLILFVILTIAAIPGAWLVLHFMNLSGAPASAVMYEIERTMFVFTLASAPIMAITLSILLYSLFGWGRVRGAEPPMQESPAIRSNPIAIFGWITATSLLAAFLVIWGLVELANITAMSNGTTSANQQPGTAKPLDINVTAQQWLWTFEYPDQQKITSDVLVVPIDEVNEWTDLSSELNSHLFKVAAQIGEAQKMAFKCERIALIIAGFEVPHCHLHLIPSNSMADLNFEYAVTSSNRDDLEQSSTLIIAELRRKNVAGAL